MAIIVATTSAGNSLLLTYPCVPDILCFYTEEARVSQAGGVSNDNAVGKRIACTAMPSQSLSRSSPHASDPPLLYVRAHLQNASSLLIIDRLQPTPRYTNKSGWGTGGHGEDTDSEIHCTPGEWKASRYSTVYYHHTGQPNCHYYSRGLGITWG